VILRHVRQMQRQDGVGVSTRDRLRHVTTDIAGRDHKLLVPEPRLAAHDGISDGHAKTRIAQLTDGGEGVDFLGFHHRLVHSRSRQGNGQAPSSPDSLRVRRCSTPGTAASLGDPGVLRAVIGTAAYLTGIAVLGLAIGTLLRATAAAISTLVALVLLLPGLGALLLPASWKDNVLPAGHQRRIVVYRRPDQRRSTQHWRRRSRLRGLGPHPAYPLPPWR